MTPAELYGASLRDAASRLTLREEDGTATDVPVCTYLGRLARADHDVLDRATGPVLDVGCGPGRHVVALTRRGVAALGVDASPVAIQVARDRGAAVVHGCVFGRVPHAGRWGTALLLDGNIGIGGDPARLLGRVRTLIREDGAVLCELEAPGVPGRTGRVRLEAGRDVTGWFPWARVGVDAIDGHAQLAGLSVTSVWSGEGRWFAQLAAR